MATVLNLEKWAIIPHIKGIFYLFLTTHIYKLYSISNTF